VKLDKIFLCENPHRVIQGEGNFIGKKMLLFRVSGCTLKCSNCDSKHSWKKESNISYTIQEFREYINIERSKRHYDFVMITGGAPSLYQEYLEYLFLTSTNFNFQVEDAGDKSWYNFRNMENVYFSFSPKIGALQGSTNIEEWNAFNHLPINWIAKIVVDKNDWENNFKSIKEFQEKYCIPNEKIYLMPIGTHVNEIQEQCQFLIDKCFEYNFNFSPRLHVLMFDNMRLV
jgi:7-carboxy-7-deazaguanine synthase